jgi:hypothetical protein
MIVMEPAVKKVADILETEFPDEPYWSLVVIAKRILVELDHRRSAVIKD